MLTEPILEDSIMKTLLSCEFNMDTGCVELRYSDSSMISINCTAVEDEVANSRFQRSELDWLIYNDPLSYAELRRDLSRIYFVYQNAMNRVKNKTSLFHCKKHLERSGSKCFFLLCPSKPHLASLLPTLNLQNLPNRSI